MDAPDDYLLMSGIQHFAFCRRQWALIHLEQQWAENLRTTEGQLDHARCHDDTQTERRKDLLITRGMRVVSHRLRMSGNCDVVEFRASEAGIPFSIVSPKKRISPPVGFSKPPMQRSSVVLPQPEGPSSVTNSFSPMSMLTPPSAVKPSSKTTRRSRMERIV